MGTRQHASAYAYVSIRQHASACRKKTPLQLLSVPDIDKITIRSAPLDVGRSVSICTFVPVKHVNREGVVLGYLLDSPEPKGSSTG